MDLLQYTFFQHALLGSLLTAITCGIVGTYVVARRLVFISGGITHASFGGLGLGFYLGTNPILMAMVFSVLSAFGVEWASKTQDVREDSAIAGVWALGMALGVIFIFLTPGYSPNLSAYLFGNILTISLSDIIWIAALAVVLIAVFSLYLREIVYVAFDSDFAKTQHIHVKWIEYMMMFFIALTIVLSIRLVGIMLLMSLLTLPQITVNLFTSDFKKIIWGSIVLGFLSCVVGLVLSYFLNVPSGAFIILVLVLVVLGAAWLAAPHVLDWATHTWYTVVKNRDLEAESASRAAASSEAAASAAAEEAASSQPEPEQPKGLDGRAVTGGSWAAVDVSALADDASIRAAAQQLKAQGADYGLVTLKTPDGSICYASQVPAAAQSIAETTVDPARIAAIFREEGVIPVAQLAAFKDPISSRTDRSMAIHYGDGLWLDAQKDGNAWLNPYSAAAVEYVGDLVAEVQGMGFEQVVLTNVQFPKLSRKQDYGETSGVSRADQLKADIAALQSRFAGSMTLWFSYTLDQCNTNSVSLDVPAVTLGMDNLLVTADKAMDADSRTALEQSAAGQGVQHLVLHSADIFQ